MLTQKRLKELLSYNPATGDFTRKNGKRAGYVFEKRYVRILVDRKEYQAHRLAWLYVTGGMPSEAIDHIDGNGLNNAFSNLREANRLQNNHNSKAKSRNDGLPRGVRVAWPSTRFKAEISIGNRKKHLGTFATPEEASEFYQLAADMLHGDFAYHRGQGSQAAQGGE